MSRQACLLSSVPQDVAASQYVCSRGADNLSLSRFAERWSHICKYPGVEAPLASAGCRGNFLRVVDDRLGLIVLPTFIYSRLCFYESAGERPSPSGGCWSVLSGGQEAEGR